MKILMLVDHIGPTTGGGERFAAGLAAELSDRGEEITFCVTRWAEAEARAALEGRGVRVLDLRRGGILGVSAFRPLLRLLREEDFDVLHAHMFGSNVWGTLFGRVHRVPAVVAQEQTWSYRGKLHRRLLDAVIGRAASVFVAVSEADRERMIRLERVPPEKTEVIPNAYIPRPPAEGGDLRAELGLGPETPIVGTIAQLRPQKALHVLLEAFAELDRQPVARLVIAGDGECREELEQTASSLGIAERTHFLGIREDIETLLDAFDVAALSSDFEGTPLVVVECMSFGVPVIATRVGGLPDLIEDGETGVLVPPRDPAALASGLSSLLSDAARRGEIADRGRERAKAFTIERTADHFVALYRSLLAKARA